MVLNFIIAMENYGVDDDMPFVKINLTDSSVVVFLYVSYLICFQVSWGTLSFSIVCEVCHDLSIISSTMIMWLFCIVSGLNFPSNTNLTFSNIRRSFSIFFISFCCGFAVLVAMKRKIDLMLNFKSSKYTLNQEYKLRKSDLKKLRSQEEEVSGFQLVIN